MTDLTHPQSVSLEALTAPIGEIRDTLMRHYRRLGALSRRMRFLSPTNDRSLERIALRAKPADVIALRLDERVRGVLEIYSLGDGHAEIGLSLEDGYHGQGHGRRLFEAGLERCRETGLTSADLFFSTENLAVLHLVKSHGARVRMRQGEAFASIDISTLYTPASTH